MFSLFKINKNNDYSDHGGVEGYFYILSIIILFTYFLVAQFSLEGILSLISFSIFLCIVLLLSMRGNSYIPLLYLNIGFLCTVLLSFYWNEFYGGIYFLGRTSDDWQYDVLWSIGFYDSYGLDFSRLSDHVDSVGGAAKGQHNSLAYVMLIVILRFFSSLFDGYVTYIPRFLNIFLLILMAFLSLKIYCKLLNEELNLRSKKQLILFSVVFFSPVLFFTSMHVFRDVIISLSILYILFVHISWSDLARRSKLLHFFGLLTAFALLAGLRLPLLGMLGAYFIIYWLIYSSNLKRFLLFFIFGTLALYAYKVVDFSLFIRIYDNYQILNMQRFGSLGREMFSVPMPLGLITRTFYATFTPVPNFSSVYQSLVSISTFFQVFFSLALWRSLITKSIDIKIRLLFVLAFFSVYLVSATFRHVFVFYPIAIVLVFVWFRGNVFPIGTAYFMQSIYYVFSFTGLAFLIAAIF